MCSESFDAKSRTLKCNRFVACSQKVVYEGGEKPARIAGWSGRLWRLQADSEECELKLWVANTRQRRIALDSKPKA